MTVSTITSLTALAQGLLDTAAECLAETDAGVPDLVYMAPAEPAFDCCPALILYVPQLGEESTSPLSPPMATGRRNSYGRVNLVSLMLLALRCAPQVHDDGSVSQADIEASAVEVQQDAWALWTGINCAITQGRWMDECSDVKFSRAVSIGEQGGCVGWRMTIEAELNGIPCTPGS